MLAYSLLEFQRINMGSTRVENYDIIYNNKLPDKLESESSKVEDTSETRASKLLETIPQDSEALLFPFYENSFLLETIDKIIRKRWKIIERTTRYGWLAACSYRRTVSPEDAKILSALGKKIGAENSSQAIRRIENLAEKLHPLDVPGAAIAVFTETHTALMLRQRRGSKSSTTLVKDRFPTIFTISDACAIIRTDLK